MSYVYVLKSEKDAKLYVGYSNDLRRRMAEHAKGKSRATKHRRGLKLVYYEAYMSEADAKLRERQLKRFSQAYVALKKRIMRSLA